MTATGARSPAAEPPPQLVARFKEALDRLWPEGGRLGLAVSGGPDSLAMLLLAEAAIPGQFEVATVDHQLRPEAAAECAKVAEVCAQRSIACEVIRIEVAHGNMQAQARRARYEGLAEWAARRGLSAIATGHHADDQAETLLMRLNRGSGLAGLAGVREEGMVRYHGTTLIRPLLTFRRAELGEIVGRSGLEPVQDPSNEDERYDRARIRRALAEADWLDPVALARSASLLGEAQRAVEAAAEEEYLNRAFPEGEGVRYYPGSPNRFIEIEVVMTIISRMGRAAARSDVARLTQRLHRGQTGNLAGILVRPTTEQFEGEPGPVAKWMFTPEPPRSVL
jgi:tRNA(Ile)-lysidine synthase